MTFRRGTGLKRMLLVLGLLAIGGCDPVSLWSLRCRGLDMACRFHVDLDQPNPCHGQRVKGVIGGVPPGERFAVSLKEAGPPNEAGERAYGPPIPIGEVVTDGNGNATFEFVVAQDGGIERVELMLASGTRRMSRMVPINPGCP